MVGLCVCRSGLGACHHSWGGGRLCRGHLHLSQRHCQRVYRHQWRVRAPGDLELPLEVAAIRSAVGPAPILITPGVRPLSDIGKDDQTRTMTPVSAISAGASYVVIGRPITGEWKNGAAAMSEKAHAIAIELSSAAK